MNGMLKKAGLGIALAATTLATAAPAEAQYYGRGYRGGYDRGGTALVAGIAGLAVGAAIASSNNRYRGGYYDRGYYGDPYYNRGYYADPYYNRGYRGYYNNGYYNNGYYNDYRGYRRCFVERRYDPYYGSPVRVQVCR